VGDVIVAGREAALKRRSSKAVGVARAGWAKGDRKDYKYYTVRYAKRGYVVATISYRFVKEAIFPAYVQDAKCAVRWMRANADKYPIDPKRIVAIGGSAGGHLAMMLGYSAGVPELEGNGGHAKFSSAVQVVVNLYDRLQGYPHTMDLSREVNVRCQWFINRFLEEYLSTSKRRRGH